MHHIAVAAQSFDEMLAMEAIRGIDVVLSGEFEGVRVTYLGTERDLGVILEIFSGRPNPRTEAGRDLGHVHIKGETVVLKATNGSHSWDSRSAYQFSGLLLDNAPPVNWVLPTIDSRLGGPRIHAKGRPTKQTPRSAEDRITAARP